MMIYSLPEFLRQVLVVVDKSKDEMPWIENVFKSKWAFIISLMASLLLLSSVVYVSLYEYIKPVWSIYTKWVFWGIGVPLTMVVGFTFSAGMIRALTIVYVLVRLSRDASITVDPFHHDKAGGLKFIGEFLIKVNALALIVGVFFVGEVAAAYQRGHGLWQYNVVGESISLPLLTLAFFFVPIVSVHEAMKKQRDESFERLENMLRNRYQALLSASSSKEDVDSFLGLLKVYQQISDLFPVWPMDISVWGRIGANLGLSFVPTLVGVLLEHFGKT